MPHSSNPHHEEGVTFYGREPSEVLAAFHASGLAGAGYAIVGRIVRHSARLVAGNGEYLNLFDGEKLYAGTFMRNGPAA